MEESRIDSQDNRGKSPNSLKNLIPFQKGHSGNPNGRPHSRISTYIKSQTNDGKKLIDSILFIIENSKSNYIILESIRTLLEYGWGRPVPTNDIPGDLHRTGIIILPAQTQGESGQVIEVPKTDPIEPNSNDPSTLK